MEKPVTMLSDHKNCCESIKRTGVLRYVCLGGKAGKKCGTLRSVTGTTGVMSSSSESNSCGEGDRDAGGIKVDSKVS